MKLISAFICLIVMLGLVTATPLMDCNRDCMTGYTKCTKAKAFSMVPCLADQDKCYAKCKYWYGN